MRRFLKGLRQRLSGGPERTAAQPLIAGYHRSTAPGLVILGLALLAITCFVYGFYFSTMAPARVMPFLVPLAALGMLVVWALPTGTYAPTRLLEPFYFGFVASLIIWPNYLAIALPGLPWMTMLRLFVGPLILAFLVCLSVSPNFRKKLVEVMNADPTIWRLMVVLVVWQTITLPLSSNLSLSINRYLLAQMNWSMIFVISVIAFTRRGFALHWVVMLLSLLFVLCGLGLWENQLHHVPWAGHIPSIFKIEDETVLRILIGGARAATGIYRVQATATTSLGLAEILGLAMPFAVHLAIDRYPLFLRIMGAVYMPLCVYVILLTDSRLGLVASLGSLMVYLLIWALKQWKQRPTNLLGPAVVLTYPLMALATLAATLLVGRIRNEIWGDGSQDASNESRRVQWEMALPKLMKNPIGHGVGQGGDTLGFANAAGVGTIDSYYISVLLELGVLGFIVYYGLMLRAAWIAGAEVVAAPLDRELRLLMPFSVSLVNYVIVKSVLSQDANHPLAFMMLGAVLALTYRARSQNGTLPVTAAQARAAGGAATIDKGWFSLLVNLGVGSIIAYIVFSMLRFVI